MATNGALYTYGNIHGNTELSRGHKMSPRIHRTRGG